MYPGIFYLEQATGEMHMWVRSNQSKHLDLSIQPYIGLQADGYSERIFAEWEGSSKVREWLIAVDLFSVQSDNWVV